MRIVKLEAFDNGSHDNLICDNVPIPDGWAVIPDELETPNFPFGEIVAERINDVMTVTEWAAGEIPVPTPAQREPTEIERLRADVDYLLMMEG